MTAKFLTPVVTAFDKNYKLDIKANQKIWDYVIEGGIDGIILMGSTGEFFAMSMEQRKELILAAREYIGNRVPLIVGTGTMSLEETIELSLFAENNKADGIIIVPPFYFSLPQNCIEGYFDEIANAVNTKIYIYNFPERTGYDISPEVMLRLCRKHKNIAGCKDTVINFAHTRKIIDTVLPKFPEFEVYSGYDDNFAHNVLSGGSGTIGGLTNVVPEIGSGWVKAFKENDIEKISYYQMKMNTLAKLFDFGVPFVPLVKKAMVLKGIPMEDVCLPPLQKPTEDQTELIKDILNKVSE